VAVAVSLEQLLLLLPMLSLAAWSSSEVPCPTSDQPSTPSRPLATSGSITFYGEIEELKRK